MIIITTRINKALWRPNVKLNKREIKSKLL